MTKKDISAKCREILQAYDKPDRPEILGSDYNFMMQVFKYHPHYKWYEMRGVGAPQIRVGVVDGSKYKTHCFWLHYSNGFSDCFSYVKCLKNIPKDNNIQ